MSELRISADFEVETAADAELACCVNSGCGNRFDPSCEGWNGECDPCAALACDHVAGSHRGLELDCLLCDAEPLVQDWLLVA
jgi:hypothetical protein